MADSLVLTGVKDVKKHTGTEMVRLNPKGGGDTFQLRRWWVEGGVSSVYVSATVFSVTTADGTVKLALDTKGEGSRVRIDHDGSFNFSFFGMGEISRAALFTDAFELIEHYVFPSISGGQVMTVTPAGSADRPSSGPPAPPADPTGPADSVTLVGTTTTEASGSVTGAATTSNNGSGLTVDYTSDGSTASGLVINEAGSGYEEGDAFTVDGDTGVTGTVSLAAAASSSSSGGGGGY